MGKMENLKKLSSIVVMVWKLGIVKNVRKKQVFI